MNFSVTRDGDNAIIKAMDYSTVKINGNSLLQTEARCIKIVRDAIQLACTATSTSVVPSLGNLLGSVCDTTVSVETPYGFPCIGIQCTFCIDYSDVQNDTLVALHRVLSALSE